jgi:hypothetical protein
LRRVTSTASVSLAGNRYGVDEALIGRRVELRFDPEDLTRLEVYWEGHPAGQAIPFMLGRHVHRQLPQALPPSPPPTGVDYLGIVLAAHDAQTLGQLAFRDLPVQPPMDGQPEPDFIEDHQLEHQPEEDHQLEEEPVDNHHPVDDQADDDHYRTEAQPEEDHSA